MDHLPRGQGIHQRKKSQRLRVTENVPKLVPVEKSHRVTLGLVRWPAA